MLAALGWDLATTIFSNEIVKGYKKAAEAGALGPHDVVVKVLYPLAVLKTVTRDWIRRVFQRLPHPAVKVDKKAEAVKIAHQAESSSESGSEEEEEGAVGVRGVTPHHHH